MGAGSVNTHRDAIRRVLSGHFDGGHRSMPAATVCSSDYARCRFLNLVLTDIDDRSGECLRSFLRQVVTDAALDQTILIFA